MKSRNVGISRQCFSFGLGVVLAVFVGPQPSRAADTGLAEDSSFGASRRPSPADLVNSPAEIASIRALIRAHAPEEEILRRIRSEVAAYDITAQQLADLFEEGASVAVITELAYRHGGTPASTVAPKSAEVPSDWRAGLHPEVDPVVKLLRSGAPESSILAEIEGHSAAYDPTSEEVMYLARLGASSKVLSELAYHRPTVGGRKPLDPSAKSSGRGVEAAWLQGVVELSEARVNEKVILAYARSQGASVSLSIDDIAFLRGRGVPEGVVTGLQQTDATSGTPLVARSNLVEDVIKLDACGTSAPIIALFLKSHSEFQGLTDHDMDVLASRGVSRKVISDLGDATTVVKPAVHLPITSATPAILNSTGSGGVRPYPSYPAAALQKRLQGSVTLTIAVSGSGSIKSVEVKHSSGSSILDFSTLNFVKQHWTIPASGTLCVYEASFTYRLPK